MCAACTHHACMRVLASVTCGMGDCTTDCCKGVEERRGGHSANVCAGNPSAVPARSINNWVLFPAASRRRMHAWAQQLGCGNCGRRTCVGCRLFAAAAAAWQLHHHRARIMQPTRPTPPQDPPCCTFSFSLSPAACRAPTYLLVPMPTPRGLILRPPPCCPPRHPRGVHGWLSQVTSSALLQHSQAQPAIDTKPRLQHPGHCMPVLSCLSHGQPMQRQHDGGNHSQQRTALPCSASLTDSHMAQPLMPDERCKSVRCAVHTAATPYGPASCDRCPDASRASRGAGCWRCTTACTTAAAVAGGVPGGYSTRASSALIRSTSCCRSMCWRSSWASSVSSPSSP